MKKSARSNWVMVYVLELIESGNYGTDYEGYDGGDIVDIVKKVQSALLRRVRKLKKPNSDLVNPAYWAGWNEALSDVINLIKGNR